MVYCVTCNAELSREEVRVNKLNHDRGEVVIENEVPSTCTVEGSYDEVTYCTRCEVELTRRTKSVELLDHVGGEEVAELEYSATCQATGLQNWVVYCTECNEKLSSREEVLPLLPHAGGTATCTAPANCAACGEAYGTALGHKFNTYISDKNATCTEDGTKTANCANGCGLTDTKADEGSKLGHKFNSYTSDKNATCTEDGTKTAKCANGCGLTDTKADEGSKLGHNYVLADDPDAVTVYDVCSNCGDQQAVKKQIPQYILKPLIKVLVVAACLLVVVLCVGALRSPATTTPWYKRRRYR